MFAVALQDPTSMAEARRLVAAAAAPLAMGEVASGQLALVVSELCSNVLKHGGGGHLLVDVGDHGVELLALDRGPGMADVARCMSDGYSSAGTSGHGLGAIRRLAQSMHVASWPGRGTALYVFQAAQLRGQGGSVPTGLGVDETIGTVCLPKPGEVACGDAWAFTDHADRAPHDARPQRGGEGTRTLFVVDGLGHGTEAAVAAQEALKAFAAARHDTVPGILEAVHLQLRHTRGAAIAVARIEPAGGVITFGGLGNISAAFVSSRDGTARRMVSLNGTAGHNARKFQAFEYPYAEGTLVMHSDGVGTSWSLAAYPGAHHLPPKLLAALLWRDFARGRDDATVVVAPLGPLSGTA